jgi:mannose/fructose/N-acetylgalactosamine-specific phosphotransferase system component IIC
MRGGVLAFFINMFEWLWWLIGIIGMLQLLLALVIPIKWRWLSVLFIPALLLALAALHFLAVNFAKSQVYSVYTSGLIFAGGFLYSLPFSLLGYLLQHLKMPITESAKK